MIRIYVGIGRVLEICRIYRVCEGKEVQWVILIATPPFFKTLVYKKKRDVIKCSSSEKYMGKKERRKK